MRTSPRVVFDWPEVDRVELCRATVRVADSGLMFVADAWRVSLAGGDVTICDPGGVAGLAWAVPASRGASGEVRVARLVGVREVTPRQSRLTESGVEVLCTIVDEDDGAYREAIRLVFP